MAKRVAFRGPAAGHVYHIGRAEIRARATEEETGGAFFLGEHHLLTGFGGPPPHIHDAMDHLFYVVEGEVRFFLAGSEHVAHPGTSAFVPRGIAHAFENAGPTEAKLLEFDMPGDYEKCYAELAELYPAGSNPDIESVSELMARFDTRLAE